MGGGDGGPDDSDADNGGKQRQSSKYIRTRYKIHSWKTSQNSHDISKQLLNIPIAAIDNVDYCMVAKERKRRIKPVKHLLEEREDVGMDEDDLELLDYLCSK